MELLYTNLLRCCKSASTLKLSHLSLNLMLNSKQVSRRDRNVCRLGQQAKKHNSMSTPAQSTHIPTTATWRPLRFLNTFLHGFPLLFSCSFGEIVHFPTRNLHRLRPIQLISQQFQQKFSGDQVQSWTRHVRASIKTSPVNISKLWFLSRIKVMA